MRPKKKQPRNKIIFEKIILDKSNYFRAFTFSRNSDDDDDNDSKTDHLCKPKFSPSR